MPSAIYGTRRVPDYIVMATISKISTRDARFHPAPGRGQRCRPPRPRLLLRRHATGDSAGRTGSGLAFTLGAGNELVCRAAEFYAQRLAGREIEDLMAGFGALQRTLANEQQFRWLGPHKGVVQLALASVTNACWDLWAKTRGVPLWRLLLDLSPQQLVATLDLSYLEDELTAAQAADLLREWLPSRPQREGVLTDGYPGYDTSVGWFNYPDEQVRENCRRAVAEGFTAMKLKVGSPDPERDIRRANLVREVAGDEARVMLDANQQWTLPQALAVCPRLAAIRPYWIEEPTHPDDILGHKTLAAAIAPLRLALGEHVPNRVVFKNYLQTRLCRIHPGRRRPRGGHQRVSRREPALPQVRRAGRAARGRHGADPPAPRALQSRSPGQ